MTHKQHRRRSKIETEIPADVREELHRLLLEESATYEEISQWCKRRGFDISRSAVGRYGKAFFEAYQNIKRFEEQSKVIKSKDGDSLTMEEAAGKLMVQKIMAALVNDDIDILEQNKIILAFASLQNANVRREKVKIQSDTTDRPALFLEHLEWIIHKIQETDPEGFGVLARNMEFLTAKYKAEYA